MSKPLGSPLPNSPYAISASMPLWSDVVAYEEGDPKTLAALDVAYPRFRFPPQVRKLISQVENKSPAEKGFIFPSAKVAARAQLFIREQSGAESRITEYGREGVFCLLVGEAGAEAAKLYWQHSGEIVSARHAEIALQEIEPVTLERGISAKKAIKGLISSASACKDEDILLYPTGMAALAHCNSALRAYRGDKKSVRFGFGYVDAIHLLNKIGGSLQILRTSDATSETLESILRHEKVSAVHLEFPTNPLLDVLDICKCSEICRKHEIPLVVDDTISTYWNVDLLPYADIIWTSLTKYFSGEGDVMGGAVIVSPLSPIKDAIKTCLLSTYEDLLHPADALVLANNSKDAESRVKIINKRGQALAQFLSDHPVVDSVNYPSIKNREAYDRIKRPGAGYSGLLSVVLKNAQKNAPKFYNALSLPKGPNLGTNFTLVCPYTLLAHYNELGWAENHGMSRYLVRISAGLEDEAYLIESFKRALDQVN